MKATILIVGTSRISRNYIGQFLEDNGYQVYQLDGFDKKKIFDRIENEGVDLVLFDLYVAEDGLLEIAKEIKRKYSSVVMAVLPFDEGFLKETAKAEIDEVLIKPVDLHQLKISTDMALRIRMFYQTRRMISKDNEEIRIRNKQEIKKLNEQIEKQKDEISYLNIENEKKAERIKELNTQNERLTYETVQIIYKLSEYRDYETHEHTIRVGWISRRLAEIMGMDKEFSETIELAAPLHDIGKIGIPDSILLKTGRLEKEEFEEMKKHTRYGYELLKDSSTYVLRLAAEIALSHHERWNGSGYPMGLKGEKIPISAQIVGVADSFDAMVTDRPYKRAKSFAEALREIKENSGILYSPEVVKALLELEKELIEKYSKNMSKKRKYLKSFDLPQGEESWR